MKKVFTPGSRNFRKLVLIPGVVLIVIGLRLVSVQKNERDLKTGIYFVAKEDIAEGNVIQFSGGLRRYPNHTIATQTAMVNEKYGFREINEGAEIGVETASFSSYDEVVEKYLEKRNGKNWRNRYYQEIHEAFDFETTTKN